MLTYDMLVIGFGKAGKTLAGKFAKAGKKVAIIEESPSMYGGTCINIACIPTKTMIVAADKGWDFDQVMAERQAVTQRLNGKNYAAATGNGVDVIDAKARFISNKVVQAQKGDDSTQITADIIIINTGAVSNILPIPGLADSPLAYDSTAIQQLDKQPRRLGVLGAGPIGLEFASLYNKLGSQVTVLDASETFLPRTEPSIAQLAKGYLEEDGITIKQGVHTNLVRTEANQVTLVTDQGDFSFDALLYATGRKPNTAGLGLENTEISLTDRGAIVVDKHLETTVAGVFAVGDVNGGPQFTYASLDDSRIVLSYLTGDGSYNLETRHTLPNTLFIHPALASVGLTEAQAKAQGLPVASKEMPVAGMPRAHVNGDLRGAFKAVVNPETKEILGATIFAQGAEEIINLITMAMDNHIPYTYFTQQIFTHPTLAENLNDLFAI